MGAIQLAAFGRKTEDLAVRQHPEHHAVAGAAHLDAPRAQRHGKRFFDLADFRYAAEDALEVSLNASNRALAL